jgi:hypothetical protein
VDRKSRLAFNGCYALAWFPQLLRATPAEREQVELSRVGLHWEKLDEDISIAGLLAGRGDVTRSTEHAA